MSASLPRILYLIAAFAWFLLLYPNPVTIFLAACLACLTLPLYRKLRLKAVRWRRKLIRKKRTKMTAFLIHFSRWMPVMGFTTAIISSVFIPLAALALIVSPQAAAGLAYLRELRASNFKLPPSWLEYFANLRHIISEYPRIEKIFNDAITNLDSLFSDAVGMLVSRSFGFVGSTMGMFWLTFLFFTIAVLFVVYGRLIRKVACRILHIPSILLIHFITAIHKALKAIMLGIVFVALVQGALCGIGFTVAGVAQPAFWGMLATVVAPIPAVGTALVWLPLAISLWFSGNTVAAVGLVLWGALFVAGVDNILRPFFLRQGIDASFFVLILAILCGLSVFGAVGLIAGPVLLAIGKQAYDEANRLYKPSL